MEIQTDLALEKKEALGQIDCRTEGIIIQRKEDSVSGINVTEIEIKSLSGSKKMNRPLGNYYTLEFQDKTKEAEISQEAERIIRKLLPTHVDTILIAGLGNADMTADALGPETIEKMYASRAVFGNGKGVAAIAPGVSSQSGMESAEMIEGVCHRIKPGAVILIDALAARSSFRLGKTIQITDTGILPGSGIGNSRKRIDQDLLGVPVISIGIPTVVSAASIVCDALSVMDEVFGGKEITGELSEMSTEERTRLIFEIMSPRIGDLYVAPKDMDAFVLRMSRLLADTLNRMLSEQMGM